MSSPLTKEQVESSKGAIHECQVCQQELERMRLLGLETGELEERQKQLLGFHEKVVEIYGPLVGQSAKSKTRK